MLHLNPQRFQRIDVAAPRASSCCQVGGWALCSCNVFLYFLVWLLVLGLVGYVVCLTSMCLSVAAWCAERCVCRCFLCRFLLLTYAGSNSLHKAFHSGRWCTECPSHSLGGPAGEESVQGEMMRNRCWSVPSLGTFAGVTSGAVKAWQ